MNKNVIAILKSVLSNEASLEEAKELLLELDVEDTIIEEIEYLEDNNFKDINDRITILIENIENENTNCRKITHRDLLNPNFIKQSVINDLDLLINEIRKGK